MMIPMAEWHLAVARVSVFLSPDGAVSPTLWQDVVGEEPETSLVQRATATRTASGPYADGSLSLQVQPMRIDWVLEPLPAMDSGAMPELGPFPTAAGPLLDLCRFWAKTEAFPSMLRIALGLVLMSPTPDRDSGYRELAELIDGVPTDGDATDFLYQINKPRDSRRAVGLRLNRLSKWSVGSYQLIGVVAGNPLKGQERCHLRLELDINTPADRDVPLPAENVEAILDDLFDGAIEVCKFGKLA